MIQKPHDAKQIFLEAIEHAPEEWPKFLETACAGNESLRARVASLLSAHTASASIIDHPESNAPPLVGEQVGDWIGPYRIVSQIGEGAYGNVYLVEQTVPLRRRLAMKILKAGVDTRQVIRRFEAERETLAQLEHPNISRIVDAGATANGRPYFVMEHVNGRSLTDHCRESQSTIRERLRLFIEVCRAVEHAHQRGIIHRDLKPSNIMVALVDGIATVKVIDFGVSKALSPSEGLTASHSMLPNLLGTPNYMSPEQFSIGQTSVDARSDVYSLGMILFELLVGRPVHNDQDLRRMNLLELARLMSDEVIPPPSRFLQKCYAQSSGTQTPADLGMTLNDLRTELRPELDWIVVKAIEKSPDQRYPSSELLAADVQAYLSGEVVTARPPSTWYVATKVFHRHRKSIAYASAICAILASAWVAIAWERSRATDVLNAKVHADAEQQLEQQELLVQQYPNDIHRAWSLTRHGLGEAAKQLLDRYVPIEGGVDRRDFAWHYLQHCLTADIQHFEGMPGPILSSDISPDKQWIAAGDRLGSVCVWSVTSGALVKQWKYSDKEVTTIRFSPDGQCLATAGQDTKVHLWDTHNWNETLSFGTHDKTITSVSWEPGGKRIATGGRDNKIVIWDAATGTSVKAFMNLEDVVRSVEWSDDGQILAAAEGPSVHLWRTGDWSTLKHFHNQTETLHCIAFKPNNSELLAVGHGGHLYVYDTQDLEHSASVPANGHLWSAAWSPAGDHLAIGTGLGGPHIWRNGTSGLSKVLNILERSSVQRTAKYTADGQWLLSAYEQQREITLWDVHKLLGYRKVTLDGYCRASQTTANLAVVFDKAHGITLRSLDNAMAPWRIETGTETAVIDSSGELLAASQGKEIEIWHIPSRTKQWSAQLDIEDICRVIFSHSGKFVAVSNADNDVLLLDAKSGQTITKNLLDGRMEPAFEFSSDDRFLYATTRRGVDCLSTTEPDSVRHYVDGTRHYRCIAVAPSGKSIFLSQRFGIVKLDIETGRFDTEHSGLLSHIITQLVVSPDDRTLAVATEAGSLHLLDAVTGIELLTLMENSLPIRDLQFESRNRLKFIIDDPQGKSTVTIFDVVHDTQ